ncbi:MAG: MurR/RpiR family transcriptional regulator [Eubacteriaceae bacterium]
MLFDERVNLQEFKLNDTDDSIIEYIQENRKRICDISIKKMAKKLFISPNSIMRAARKLGYSGFSELKYAISAEENKNGINTVQHNVLSRMPQNIVRSMDVMDEIVLQQVVETMLKANKVIFAGVGDSVYFCEMLGKNLRCLNKEVEYYQQIHDMEFSAKKSTKEDVIIIISASGEKSRLVDIAKRGIKNGAKTVAITSYGENPLNRCCDLTLFFWGEQRIVNGYNVTDRSGLMMLIRMISEKYWRGHCV